MTTSAGTGCQSSTFDLDDLDRSIGQVVPSVGAR